MATRTSVLAIALAAVLALLLPRLARSAPVAYQSEVLRIDLRRAVAPTLTDLQAAAAKAGMQCRTVIHAAHGRHAPPPERGPQCTTPASGAFFEAFVPTDRAQVLVKIYVAAGPTPHGESDPTIDRVLGAYKRALGRSHNLKKLQRCLTPDVDACLSDST